MDTQEKDQILLSAQRLATRELEVLEPKSESMEDPYSDMATDEKSKLLIEQQRRLDENRDLIASLLQKIDKLTEYQVTSAEEMRQLRLQLVNQAALLKKIASLEEQLRLARKNRFGSKSQKRNNKTDDDNSANTPVSHEEAKGGFDGTEESLPQEPTGTSDAAADTVDTAESARSVSGEKEERLFRQGMTYTTMCADKKIVHKSDRTKLPAGAVIIEIKTGYSYEQVSQIIEHGWEIIRYKTADGKICEGYFPAEGEPLYVDKVEGTHASSDFMAHLAFNKYVLDTPLYREMYRIVNEKMSLSRQTLTNWLHKGGFFINEIVDRIMDLCICDGADINGDETWTRVKGKNNKYTKKYIWCCVNKKTKTVIYRYENGSRGRDVLKHIIGDRKIRSFQSDGYNVYMYLDNQVIDVDHLCCMAHARAKFKYAYDQGDKDAGIILDIIAELYRLEEDYKQGKLDSEQIAECRQGLKTTEIIIRLRSKLDAMLADGHPPYGELMEKALRYLKNFWKQLFAYLKNGDYTIDNTLAERCIRPLACERKNSLFFGSDKMAKVSAAYHTVISTCSLLGVSALEYLKKFFGAIAQGRRDYANLMPQTIGILPNKH